MTDKAKPWDASDQQTPPMSFRASSPTHKRLIQRLAKKHGVSTASFMRQIIEALAVAEYGEPGESDE